MIRFCRFLRLSVFHVIGGVLVGCLLWGGAAPRAGQAQAIAPDLRQQVERDLRGEDLRGKDGPLASVGSHLALMYRAFERHQRTKAGQPFRPQRFARSVTPGGLVAIDAIATRRLAALRADLERIGLQRAATAGRVVSGYLPIESIPEAARLTTLRSAQVAVAQVRVGATTTQGDVAIQANSARNNTGATGSGITVGVLSDSYDMNVDAATSAIDDIQSGDLPPSDRIAVLEDAGGSDEGRAMMQIIHDVAPGADLAFQTALGGQGNFAQGIRDLAAAGADVIVDDIFYLTEPIFQDGIIAQAVDEVVADGFSYFSAAGNSADESYASAFTAAAETGPGGGTLHDFGGGDTRQQITIPEGDSVSISFQWVDPYASAGGEGARSDLDIYLLDQNGNEVASSIFDNNGSPSREASDPIELLQYKNEGEVDADGDGTPDETFDLVIEIVDGPEPERIKYIFFPGDADPDDGATVRIDEYLTGSPTIFGHSNAAGAGTTGAVFWFATPAFSDEFTNPFAVNPFSSVGGTPIYFRPDGTALVTPEVRQKPDVVGPDGGNNTFFGQQLNDGDNFPNFFGTSAAAPHVAAVAALILEAGSAQDPLQVYANLEETALDMTEVLVSGGGTEPIPNGEDFDFFSGHGLVQADAAIQLNTEIISVQGDLISGADQIRLRWTETDQSDITRYFVDQRLFDGDFQQIATVPSEGAQAYSITTDPLGLGVYTFRVRWERSDNTTDASPIMPRVTVGLQSFTASFDAEEGDAVDLVWTVPPATTGYRYLVQRRSDGSFTTTVATTERAATVDNLQPGEHDFRLVMERVDGSGAFSSVVRSAQIPFEGAIAMGEAYPNPASGLINVPVTLDAKQSVTIRVFDAMGRLVKIRGRQLDLNVPSTLTIEPGDTWASGVYFIRVEGDGFSETRQAVLVR